MLEEIQIRGDGLAWPAGQVAEVESLGLFGSDVGDGSLAKLASLKGLKQLLASAEAAQGHRRWAGRLKEMTELETLSLSATPIRGPGLANLKAMSKLQTLSFNEMSGFDLWPLTDVGLAQIEDLPALTSLDLDHTSITDAGTVSLQKIKSPERTVDYQYPHRERRSGTPGDTP